MFDPFIQPLRSGSHIKALTVLVNHLSARRAVPLGMRPWGFSSKELASMMEEPNRHYQTFTLPKKSGGRRQIHAPEPALKMVQWALAPFFRTMFSPARCSFGFERGRSIAENARVHVGQDWVLNADIQDFFPSISTGRLERTFRSDWGPPVSVYMAHCLAKLVTYQGRLPQGSPCSPVLTNLVAVDLDVRLEGLARHFGCRYSRYVDDLTFSSPGQRALQEVLPRLVRVLASEGFELNPKKTRLQPASVRQGITGLVLTSAKSGTAPCVSVPREFRRQTRAMLHAWRTRGLAQAAQHADQSPQQFARSIEGRIAHIRHIRRSPESERFHTQLQHLLRTDGAPPCSIAASSLAIGAATDGGGQGNE